MVVTDSVAESELFPKIHPQPLLYERRGVKSPPFVKGDLGDFRLSVDVTFFYLYYIWDKLG